MAADTLLLMGMTGARPRPVLVVEQKQDGYFDPGKHPRAHDGRFSHVPGGAVAEGVSKARSFDDLAAPSLASRAPAAGQKDETRLELQDGQVVFVPTGKKVDVLAKPDPSALSLERAMVEGYIRDDVHARLSEQLRSGEIGTHPPREPVWDGPAHYAAGPEGQVEALDAYIGRTQAKSDAQVWRGMTFPEGRPFKVGDTFEDKAFVSTTGDRSKAEEFAKFRATGESANLAASARKADGTPYLLQIKVPAGTPIGAGDPSVQEYLLPRRSSFRVVGVIEDNGSRILQVEVTPPTYSKRSEGKARLRPSLTYEAKHDANFDPGKHPRAHDGRFAHTPGEGWRIAAGRYRATSVSNLRAGDTIFTGGDSHAELAKPVGTTDSVIPASHRRQRTVERVEQGNADITVHFTDGTSVSESWANHPVYAPRDAKPAAKDDGMPDGWSLVSADAKEQEWRADARSMYDALKADGVDLPDFEAYYARVTERNGMKFDAGKDLTRQVGKTHVKIVTADLPQEHWARAAADIEAIVGGDNAKDEIAFAFRASSFTGNPAMLGYTNLGANHIEVNPVVYTREKVLNTGGLMKSARGNLPRYVIAHEYGHALGAGKDHDHEVEQVWVDHPGVSLYGRTKPTEGAAEAYADWVMTGGKTDNEFTKAMAKLEGWS